MKVILTGYKGFIGKNLLKEFLAREWEVILIEKDSNYKSPQLEEMVKTCDVIFHVGAISDTALQDVNEMMYYNYTCSKILFSLAQKYSKKVIYSSSAAVYGKQGTPSNIYAWSKLAAEDYGVKTCDNFVALRYFNVYGPGEEHKGKMSSLAYQAWQTGEFTLFPGEPKRDFVYIKDVIDANLKAIDARNGVYEIGYGEARLFEDLLKGMGISKIEYHSDDKIPFWYQNHTRALKCKRVPGWEAKYNVEEGTKDYIEYLK